MEIIGDPTEWSIRLSTKAIIDPCALCGSKIIRIPYETATSTGAAVCPLCCKTVNSALHELLQYYLDHIQTVCGELQYDTKSQVFIFGLGVTIDYKPEERSFEFVTDLAIQLEQLNCLATYYVNIGSIFFSGKLLVHRHSGSKHSEIAERAIKETIDKYPDLASYVRYFYLWNKSKLGGINSAQPLQTTSISEN